MLIELPGVYEDEDSGKLKRFILRVNPLMIASVEPADKKTCYVVMTADLYYEVELTPDQIVERLADWVRENALLKLYKGPDEAKN